MTPKPKREQRADKASIQAPTVHEPRDSGSRAASQARNMVGVVAGPEASTLARTELFILGLAGALALALMLLAAVPPHVLEGVSGALADRRREVEVIMAAVLWSLVIGLLVARCAVQPS